MPTSYATPFVTYHEVISHLIDFAGADVSKEAERDARRAIQDAYREFANSHKWSYLYQHGRISTNAHYNTGTIAYNNTTRYVTLTDGTWPSWASLGMVQIGAIAYEVATRVSSTVLLLRESSNPGEDVDAGTEYSIWRDTYPLPCDFISADEMVNHSQSLYLNYVHPRSWLQRHRIEHSPAVPYLYTITGDPNYQGVMALRFFPPPDDDYQIDFIYHRRPRQLLIDNYDTGYATAEIGNTTVGGTSTSWTDRMIGSVIRFSASRTESADSLTGQYPFLYERVIVGINSTTSLEVDASLPEALSGVQYRISDPVDIEPGAMTSAFLRCCEYKMAIARNMKDKADPLSLYQRELILAKEADSRTFNRRAAGMQIPYRTRLAHMPTGPDLP